MVETCLKRRIGELHTDTPPPFYGDRVGVILKAILVYEKTKGVLTQNGCSPHTSLLLKKIYENNIDEKGLNAFQKLGLPVNCQDRFNVGSHHPAWWNIVYSSPRTVTYDKLIRLEKLGISLLETDSNGNQFFSSNLNSFCHYTDDSALLHFINRGVNMNFVDEYSPPLSVELVLRRLGYRDDNTKTDDFENLLEAVGEPSLAQLQEAKARPWSERTESDPRSIALHDYLDKRISELEGKNQDIKGVE